MTRLVVLGKAESQKSRQLLDQLQERFELLTPGSLYEGLRLLGGDQTLGVVVPDVGNRCDGLLLHSRGMLDYFPEGIAIVDGQHRVLWANRQLWKFGGGEPRLEADLYQILGLKHAPEQDCPLTEAARGGECACRTLRPRENRYYEIQATVIPDAETPSDEPLLMVSVRDVSEREINRQKFTAIYQAGLDLGDLSPLDVTEMSEAERVELLKSKILHYTQDVMQYETIEIRLLDKASGQLNSLLQVGMQPLAADRELHASAEGNGVTGFVAATGKSYLCKDTAQDPLYLPGAHDARSSLTVPLILHEEVLGTFNVESTEPDAFDEQDLQFLELFSREIAGAINTLELLVAEKATTATESTQLILKEVATPVDEILNDAAWILEKYIGHDDGLCQRLQRILKDARQIRQLIHRAGESLTPTDGPHGLPSRPKRPALRGKRILVADSDEMVRQTAHELLERYGCEVETAHNGEESFLMARSFQYDAVITDIRLPDMNGFDCFCELKGIDEHLPVILMTGYGYDPTHSIVKARQQGLKGVLYKPFRLDQLLDEVESAVTGSDRRTFPS